ncbi:MAG: helix-turn-helix transcriptional regulator [Bifidobacterium dentium]
MDNTQDSNEWMTRKEAAAYTKTTAGTLATLAYQHRGPRMFKPSPRKVIYRRSDLDAWLTGTEVTA